ncbi:hypothetical protein ACHAQD_011369 [Fusarium lateritium]
MLLIEAFTELLEQVDSKDLSGLIDEEWRLKIAVSLFQACLRVMLEQRDDGSWGGYREQTCYAVLALAQGRRLCFVNDIRAQLQTCIDRAIAWLRSSSFDSRDLCWTSKTAYGVTFVDEWQIRASVIESSFFVPLLRARRLDIYPRDDGMLEKDIYLSIIPFTWIGCNNRSQTFASNNCLYDMMLLSLLGYQTDEYMEATIGPAVSQGFQLQRAINDMIESSTQAPGTDRDEYGDITVSLTVKEMVNDPERNSHDGASSPFQDIINSLTKFTTRVLNHEAVLRSSLWDREKLHQEFKTFLQSHATQLEDNIRFAKQSKGDVFNSPTQSYFHWVNSTGGSHVACAYSFAFSNCLISTSHYQGQEAFPTVTQKYLISDIMRHATAMCRMYNDFGSISRDEAERNVNSIHFPDFASCNRTSYEPVESRKERLGQLAEYEQACLSHALAALERDCYRSQRKNGTISIEARKLSIVRLFCDVTDLYDQLYVAQDLSSRLK